MVSLQTFEGNWELNKALADLLGKPLHELEKSAEPQVVFSWQKILIRKYHFSFARYHKSVLPGRGKP